MSDSASIKDLTVIVRLWLDPSDVTVRGRVLVPVCDVDQVVRSEQQVIELVAAIVRRFERGDCEPDAR